MIKKFLSNSQFYIYSAYLPTLISLFTLPITTPYLTLRDYGIYGLLFSVYSFASLVFNLGFAVEYQNTYFNERETYRSRWSRIIGFQLTWNLITCLPFAAILLTFVVNQLSKTEAIVTLSCLLLPYLVLDPIKTIGSRHLQYTDKHKSLFVITSIGIVCQYTLVIYLIVNLRLGFMGWFISHLFNTLITASIYLFYLKKNGVMIQLNFSFSELKRRIKRQSFLVVINISDYILEISDRVVLSLFRVPIEQIGVYNIACNYTNYGQTVNNALNTVFSPMYFKSITKDGEAMNESQLSDLFKFWINLIFFTTINMVIWADYLFAFLYRNQTLKDTYIYAFPMILSLIYRPFCVMVVDNLIIQEKAKYTVYISVFGAVLNIVLNVIFVPIYGIIASVYATAISYIFLGFSGFIIPRIRRELTKVYFKNYFFAMIMLLMGIAVIGFIDFSQISVKVTVFVISVIYVYFSNKKRITDYFKKRAVLNF